MHADLNISIAGTAFAASAANIKRKTTGKTRKEKKQVDFSSEDVLCVISKNVSILNVIENLV